MARCRSINIAGPVTKRTSPHISRLETVAAGQTTGLLLRHELQAQTQPALPICDSFSRVLHPLLEVPPTMSSSDPLLPRCWRLQEEPDANRSKTTTPSTDLCRPLLRLLAWSGSRAPLPVVPYSRSFLISSLVVVRRAPANPRAG